MKLICLVLAMVITVVTCQVVEASFGVVASWIFNLTLVWWMNYHAVMYTFFEEHINV